MVFRDVFRAFKGVREIVFPLHTYFNAFLEIAWLFFRISQYSYESVLDMAILEPVARKANPIRRTTVETKTTAGAKAVVVAIRFFCCVLRF